MAGETLIHSCKVLLRLEEGCSQTTEAERQMIARFAQGARRAVEIGVYEGVTSSVIAAALAPGGRLYAVDPFFSGRLGLCYGKWVARSLLRRRGLLPRVEFVQMLSWEASRALEGDFDFVFFDGDHSWEAVERDWNDWSGRIAAEGVVALHDTSVPEHDPTVAQLGSCRYFQERIRHDERFERVAGVDSLNVLRRRARSDGSD